MLEKTTWSSHLITRNKRPAGAGGVTACDQGTQERDAVAVLRLGPETPRAYFALVCCTRTQARLFRDVFV